MSREHITTSSLPQIQTTAIYRHEKLFYPIRLLDLWGSLGCWLVCLYPKTVEAASDAPSSGAFSSSGTRFNICLKSLWRGKQESKRERSPALVIILSWTGAKTSKLQAAAAYSVIKLYFLFYVFSFFIIYVCVIFITGPSGFYPKLNSYETSLYMLSRIFLGVFVECFFVNY